MNLPALQSEIEKKVGALIWTTRDGEEIPLSDMSERHIDNALAILIPWRRDCRKRGERQMTIVLGDTIRILRRERRRR